MDRFERVENSYSALIPTQMGVLDRIDRTFSMPVRKLQCENEFLVKLDCAWA